MNELHDLTVSQGISETHQVPADGHPLPIDHAAVELHLTNVDGHFLAGSHTRYALQSPPAASQLLTVSHSQFETHGDPADGHPLPIDHGPIETHNHDVDGHFLAGSHTRHALQPSNAASQLLTVSHSSFETQMFAADGHLLPTDQCYLETHTSDVGGLDLAVPLTQPPTVASRTQTLAGGEGWGELRICADLFYRAQRERIAIANLLRTSDHDMFGPHLAQLEATEHAARLMLRRCYRRVVPNSLKALQKAEAGLGEDSFARILGHLGDPYIATPHWWQGTGANRTLMVGETYVRTISQLWQYCGHGAPGRVTKGITAEELAGLGNPTVKMLVHIQAEFCMKQKGRYRLLYEAVRSQVEDKRHTVPCVRCGPSGKPAQDGTPWAKGHQHAHALRVIGKEILRDMWLARHLEETA